MITNTPLNILNGTPERRTTRCERATLPVNQLKSTNLAEVHSNSNVRRCKYYL